MLRLILSALCLAPLVTWTAELPAYRGDLNEFDNIQHLPSGDGPARLVLGDNNGRIHIYEAHGDAYNEVWVSDYLEGAVSGVYIVDINDDELDEIVTYTDQGRIYYFDTDYLWFQTAIPTQYFESGIETGDPFAINRLGQEGLYRTMGELLCSFFGAQGSIRDLS